MGAEQAVIAKQQLSLLGTDFVHMSHFAPEIVVSLELKEKGDWILMGKVTIFNKDLFDPQNASAKLFLGTSVVDEVNVRIPSETSECIYLQAGLNFDGGSEDTVTLQCDTYTGSAWKGSIVAIKVDNIEYQ